MPRPWLTSCSNVSIGLTISEGVHDLWLPSASRIPNIDIMVWVSCSRGMSHFLILAPFPFQIILCIFFLFPVLCVTPPSITALPSSIPLSPPVCFYVTFVSSLFLHLSSCVVLCNIWLHCRQGETQSHAPNQPVKNCVKFQQSPVKSGSVSNVEHSTKPGGVRCELNFCVGSPVTEAYGKLDEVSELSWSYVGDNASSTESSCRMIMEKRPENDILVDFQTGVTSQCWSDVYIQIRY